MPRIEKLLVANRGEIACRVMATCRRLGIATVAVYSEVDADAAHVAAADEATLLGPAPARESYLRSDRIIEAALKAGAQAIHPGYGFLAESPEFARAVLDAGLLWVGPAPEVISSMGDKDRARAIANKAGVPILHGSQRFPVGNLNGLHEAGATVGFPLLVKAASGGGGIGMRLVKRPDDLEGVVAATQSMAERSFGEGTVYLERYVPKARHVEVQVFGFGDGTAVHLFERDCSVQRRYQKVVEEAPAPDLPDAVRTAMQKAAVNLAASVNYEGAGTVEFIYDVEKQVFHFLEMNTRIQVEHPATEMITGVDIVEWQLRQTEGAFAMPTIDPAPDGHAIEVRIYAERPEKNFLPAPGTVTRITWPEPSEDLRVDHAVRSGDSITPFYDPMIAKLIVRGADRISALKLMARALAQVRVEGVPTNLDFLGKLLDSIEFQNADLSTDLIGRFSPRTLERQKSVFIQSH
ncbi:carbamoyl-phosphate synthase [Nitratireductor indicus C115]|uniref:Carbamoyl-phosphate synthase n=1 Tax=Nitratireductor indicus C115 TaxID=1231190 RepID=K2NV80_9HYPH|nr:biotin carboxylase N-terminal domain-containing protein [Nitratireductor indicus]EKF43230.1 carbamoyl-phosphate synthase [Nitratireductor indicus C115]SFQ53898.1 3-methylcrotonyl-CoA carboxylase alpha subunit [Nitratireductor indicus]